MKKILFIVVPLTVLIIVVFQTMIPNVTKQNLASVLLAQQPDEENFDYVDEPVMITMEAPPKENLKPKPNAKSQKENSKTKTPEDQKTTGKKVKREAEAPKKQPTVNEAQEKVKTEAPKNQAAEKQKSAETTEKTQSLETSEVQKAVESTTTETPTETMAATLLGTPSVYSTVMQQRTAVESAQVAPIQPPAYVFDITQLNSPTVEQLKQRYDLHPIENVVGQTLGQKDTDGDGLSDAEELRIGTTPRKLDSDGDSVNDGDEVLIYHTNPLDLNDPPRTPENKLDMKKIGIRITSFSDNQLVADSTPLIRGVAPAGAFVKVVATNNETKQNFVLGQALANESNVFILEPSPSISLPDGDYSLKAYLIRTTFNASDIAAQVLNPGNTTDQTLNDSQPIRAKIRSKLDVNPPAPKKLADKFLEGDAIIKNARIEIRDRKPVLVGKTVYGSQVLTTWHSLVMTSALIADTSFGDFEIQPQQEMEFGEHDVYIQAVRPTDGALSKAVKVAFKIEQPVAQTVTTAAPLKPSAEPASNAVQKSPETKGGFAVFMEKQNVLLWSITGGSLLVIIIVGVMIFVSRKKKVPPLV